MKREKTRTNEPNPGGKKHVGEDAAKLIAEISPGKKGGDFELPFGGQISIQPGTLNKRDVVTCCMVTPSDRFKYQPSLSNSENLCSEIFLLATSCKTLRNENKLGLKLPYYAENLDVYELKLLAKGSESEKWRHVDCTFNEKSRLAEFETDVGGIYVIISGRKTETFEVSPQGCLYNARIHHQLSLRFPKRATDVTISCELQIETLNRSSLAHLREEYPSDFADLLEASDTYTILPSVHKEYKRPVTVKVPIAPLEEGQFAPDDVAVMQMTSNGWQLLEAPLKFVKNAVAFDTKILTSYCVALATPNRKRRLLECFAHMEREKSAIRGEILPFIHIQEKTWTLWIECVPNERVNKVLDKRQKEGFLRIRKTDLPIMTDTPKKVEPVAIRKTSKSRPSPKVVVEGAKERVGIDLVSGSAFDIEICGDIKLSEEDPGHVNLRLQYHSRVPENYRRFIVEPVPMEDDFSRVCTGFIKCYASGPSGERFCVRHFDFDIETSAVRAYLHVEPEAEPEPEADVEPEAEALEEKIEVPVSPPSPKQVKGSRPNTASFVRLTTLTKPPRIIFKEPKVLTGRSLRCLAREVEQGLTLAIHLDISDSTITGMGFDALANGLSLVDITYKILLLWKRRTKMFKERQVNLLAEAFEGMGRGDISETILNKHRLNVELTPECFEASAGE